MALIKCKECEKDYSDTLDACPHCGFKNEQEKEKIEEKKEKETEEKSVVEEFIKKIISDKKRLVSLIGGIFSLICSVIFLAEMNLSGIPLVFTMSLIIASTTNILYTLGIIKKFNNDMLLLGMAAVLIGFILRTVQTGIIYSWQYFVAYFIFSVIMLFVIYKFTKNEGKENILNALLIIATIYDIFEFFNSRSPYIKGIYWRIYHLAEAGLFLNYISIILLNKNKYEDFSKSLGNYKKQIVSKKISIIILVIISAIAMTIGIIKQANNKSNNSINNNTNKTTQTLESNSSSTSSKDKNKEIKNEEKQKYINEYFELLGANVKYFEKSYTEDEWGLENIEVKNKGDKNVKSFKITVYFKDDAGNNIAENTFNITETIKANYSWKLDNGRYYELENLSSEVDPSKNEIRITDIEFATKSESITIEKQEYINTKFNLIGANVKYFEKSYTEDEWGLENIEIKNAGDKNVKSFKITVYFKDDAGNNIAENTFNITETIKANYSWKLDSGRYYELENLSSEVDPSKNEIKITDIEYSN